MGHKVHPTGIRLGIAKDWNSKWYANKGEYAKYLAADLKVREMLPRVPHPGLDHEVQIAGVAVKMTETPGKVRHRAPLLGEHTDEYLKSIGCSSPDIERLRTRWSLLHGPARSDLP